MIDYQRLKTDLCALGLMAAVLFMALALVSHDLADPPSTLVYPQAESISNLCGPAGALLAHYLLMTFGLGAWFVWLGLLIADLSLFSRQEHSDPGVRILGGVAALLAVCAASQIAFPDVYIAPVVGSGGYIGAWAEILLTTHFSTAGALIVIGTTFSAGMLLATDAFFFRLLYRVGRWFLLAPLSFLKRCAAVLTERPVSNAVVEDAPVVEEAPVEEEPEETEDALDTPEFKVNPPVAIRPVRTAPPSPPVDESRERPEYELPDIDLLEDAEDFPFEELATRAQSVARTLEKTFEQFGLKVRVTEVDTGPVVTLFELDLEPGLRVSKVVNLQDDLAIALRVPAVRIVSPIPGKNTVGVEVPNDTRVNVRLRELIESADGLEKQRIPIFLGKDVSGHPLTVDLSKMPHLLIAGRTGTGKSVCLNTLILSMLMTRSPEDVRMLMIDPKMVELSPYTKIPHLMHPVITDMKKAEALLAWAVDKMEERYDLLARVGVRHLDSYNKLGKEKVLERLGLDPDDPDVDGIPDRMPYIVIVADEMADMMMTSGKEVEGLIIRLAQKSRAVGIHLVLATQKPTVDVITGLIKSNLPARISFQVSSRTDSRVVLDSMGAERLLGNGDMLYLAPGTSNLSRAQGTYVSDDEVNAVIDFYSEYEPQYSAEIEQATSNANAPAGGASGERPRDDHYEQAIEIVIREGRGSVSLLQRALGIGYGRAARMIDWMAEDGIVGDYNGSKCREVICTMEQWEAMQGEGVFG